ncbi:GtrA family protein [Stenotrophomonas sp. ATCM1_4]|uniref:GtrA family protein n=1 Tax=Stenotrophomonas sp. ATCM1_4 TaxID=2259330 RepID=UPI0014043934|nr:GtrA family protein [Stenotrophomonas sp. ATCM1_4]
MAPVEQPHCVKRSSTKRQVILYAVVGGVQLSVDWLTFTTLTSLGISVVVANPFARIVGAVLGFWLNGKLTFAVSEPLKASQAAKFAVSWLAMTLLSTAAIWTTEQLWGLQSAQLAKPVIDVGLAALGFLASKLWIYR